MAYRVGDKTVVRAAFGIFYSPDAMPPTELGDVNPPFTGSSAFTNNQSNFLGATLITNAFTRPAGAAPSMGAALKSIQTNFKIPTADQWNFSIEHNLPGQILPTTAYVGTSGKHLVLEPNINQPVPGPGAVAARRPFPLYSDITYLETTGSSIYHPLQVSAEKRMTHGLQFLASYTWSHAIDNGGFLYAAQNVQNLAADRGNADIDLRNRFILSGSWEIPVGRGRTFGSAMNRTLDFVIGGWQINGIASLYSGLPFTVTSGVNTLNGSGTQRPNLIGQGALPSEQRSIHEWFNVAAFQTPALYQFGNAGRNLLYGPGTREFDTSVAKFFNITEQHRFEFRAEAFNVFNTPQFNNPNATTGVANAGTITSAGSPSTFQRTSRELQLALKFYFLMELP